MSFFQHSEKMNFQNYSILFIDLDKLFFNIDTHCQTTKKRCCWLIFPVVCILFYSLADGSEACPVAGSDASSADGSDPSPADGSDPCQPLRG